MQLRLFSLWLVVLLFSGKVWSQANNDNFAGRLTLAGASATAVSNLQAATHETGEPNHANYSGTRSLWWTWTAPASGTVNFSASAGTAASTFWYYPGGITRALAVYTGSSLTALTEVANATSPSQSTLIYPLTGLPSPVASCNVQVTAGAVYQIAVDGPAFLYPGDDGTVSLAINQSPTIYSAAGASGAVGTAFSYTVLASNNPTSFNATGLPPGLSINPFSGAITGIPAAAGVYTVGLAAVNPGGTNTATLTLAIAAALPTAPSVPVIVSDAAVSGTVGASFSYYTGASGSAASYTADNLPPGLSIDVASGLITGVPTAAGITNVSLSAANAVGTGTATVVFNIIAAPSPPIITSALTASGTVGTSFTYYIDTSYDSNGSPSAYGASSLPPGLGLDPNSGVLKGTPSTPGVYSVPITATNAGGTGTAVVTIAITAAAQTAPTVPQAAAPQLSSSALATGTVGAALSYGLTASNTPTGFTASNLPPGLSLNPVTGYITGTPTGSGVFLVPVAASNAYGTSNATLTITVNATAQTTTASTLSPLVITSPAAASGTVGQSLSYAISASSNSYYYLGYGSLSFTASNLPPGLSLNATYGYITGTPTSAGTYAAAVTATPTTSYSYSVSKGSAVITFVIGATVPPPTTAPVFTNAAEVASNVGATFSGTTVFTASGSPTSYTASGLPPGLSISASSGTLSGSPTTAGTYPVTVSATNSVGTGTATVTFAVAAQAATTPPVVTSSPFAVATLGASFNYNVYANVSITSCSVGTLPPGLSFSTSNNYISGTPTTLGLYQVPIAVVTPSGTVNATLTINVLSAVTVPVITSAATVRGTIGSSLTYTITAQAGTYNPTTFTAGTLPPGMTYSNGSISGTPTTAGVYQVPISATTGAGTTNATVTFTITAPIAPAFTGSAVMSGTVGSAFSNSIYAYNSPTNYTASNLPPGLSFSSGYFSGTPTTAGVYTVPISATNAGGTANATLTINITNPVAIPVPVITSAASAAGVVGTAFSYTVAASNSPTSFDLGASTPPGLSFNATTGVLTGKPTTSGVYILPVSAANSTGTGRAVVQLNFAAQTTTAAPVISSAAGASGQVGQAFNYTLAAINSPTSFALGDSLPAGLSFNATTGVISGVPTTSSGGYFSLPVYAGNSAGQGGAVLTMNFVAPTVSYVTSAAAAGGVVGTPFNYNITTSTTVSTYGSSGTMPPGLSLNATTGKISGTPTAAGTFHLNIYPDIGYYLGFSSQLTIVVTSAASSAPVLSSSAGAAGFNGESFTYRIAASNSPTSFGAGSLPSGLNFNAATGVISGTPPATSTTYSVPISAMNASGISSGTLTLTVSYNPSGPQSITSAAATSALEGAPFSYTITTNATSSSNFTASNLPGGLILNTSTGVISGTPSVAGSFVVPVTASVSSSFSTTVSGRLTLVVAAMPTSPPVVSSAAEVSGTAGISLSYALTATNLPTTFGATNLPAGLSLNTTTGVISGTPTAAGTANVSISAVNGVGPGSATLTFVIATPAAIPPSLAGNNLTATATLGVKTVVYRIAATNNPTSYAASGLPPGLSLDPVSGAISGTPTDVGTYQTTVSAANVYGSASAVVALAVANATTAPTLSTSVAATLTGTVGTSFSLTSYASSNTNFTASGLPPGLTMSSATGEIFGAPTMAGSYTVTISAVNAIGSDSAVVTLLITNAPAQPPAFSSGNATAAGSVGASFSYSFYPSSGATCTASGLPPGLSFTPGSGYGYVRGTPTTVGVYPVTFTLGNASGTTSAVVTVAITGTPTATPVISGAAGATATVGGTFRYQIAASNTTPTGYSASGLPDGLQVNAVTGVISGTPTAAGTFPVTISATNSGGTGSAVVTLQIFGTAPAASAAPVINSAAAVYYVNSSSPYYYYYPAAPTFAYTITASGAPTSFGASSLPTGLSLNPYTGSISGTPMTAGTFAVPISATNSAGTGSAVLTIMIPDTPPALQPALAVNTAVGSFLSYSTDYYTSGVYAAYYGATIDATTFTATGLPPGLSLKSSTGDITGTPSQAGVFTTTISATSRGGTATAIITFNVAATAPATTPTTVLPPTLNGAAAVQGIVGAPMSFYLYGSGTSYASSGLPAGLTLDAFSGKISGTPTTAGVYTVPVSATNAGGTGNATLTISIAAASATPIISSSAAASATVGSAFSYSIYTEPSVNTATASSYSAGNLPPGLSLDVTRGYISGTPTTAGLYSVPIAASALGVTGNATLTINVLPAPATPATPTAPVFTGVAGSLGFTANPYLFVGTGGFTPDSMLPGSLVFDPIAGSIAGLLDTVGTFDLALSASNAGGTGHAVLRLRVVAPDLSLPRMTSQPTGQSVQQGQSVTLSGAAVGVPTPTYQWWHDGSAVPGATNTTLTLASPQPSDAGGYLLVASNAAGRANTTTVILSVAQTYAGWQSTYFTADEIAAGLAGDAYDFDGDGLPNLLDYAIGRNPVTGLGGSLPTGSISTTGNLQLQFTRDASKTDISYTVEASGDLLDWTAIARSAAGGAMANLGGARTVTESAVVGTLEAVTVQDTASPSVTGGKHFLRLRVSRP